MRAVFYGRVSSEEQAERGTIESQVDYAKKYFDLHGPEVGVTEYECYLDEGVSGTVPLSERPAGIRLLNDAREGKYHTLYVYRLDRLARSVKHVLDTYDLLESKGIALKSMTEAFDTGTPTGKFFMTLLASIAALERDTILERTQLGKERRARQGKWVSGAPPFGYRIGKDGRLEVYEPEAETIRMIFQLYLEGMSTVKIAGYLNARSIPTPAKSKGSNNKSTGKWHAGHISIILRTKAYIGEYAYLKRSKRKKEPIKLEVPVIIVSKVFAAAQLKLVENAHIARGSKGRYYLLRGLIFCGKCGRTMVGSSGMSKAGRVYYRCTGAINRGAGKICDAKMLRAKDIEEAVWQDIREFVGDPGKLLKIMDEKLALNKKDLNPICKEIEVIEQAILDRQTSRSKILSLCTRGIITDREAEKELKGLAAELKALEDRQGFLFTKQEKAQQIELETLNAQMMLAGLTERLDLLIPDEKATLIRGLVHKVQIYPMEDENSKQTSRARIFYRIGRPAKTDCMGLSIPGDAKVRRKVFV